MTHQQERKRAIRAFMQAHYTDEKLAQLLAHAQDGRLKYDSCCCFIGVATADHALRGSCDWHEPHYKIAQRESIDIAYAKGGLNAEIAYLHLAPHNYTAQGEVIRRRILIPMIRAEQRRRERMNVSMPQFPVTLHEPEMPEVYAKMEATEGL